MRYLCFIVSYFILFAALAQNDLEIKTIQLYPVGNEIGYPIISIPSNEQLILAFDVLSDDAPYLNYQIQHYSYNWEKADLNPIQFIKGFASGSIDDYAFSFNTQQLYTHYEMVFPNEQTSFIASGNYKIIVYEDSPTEPLFEKRFYVTEQVVGITGTVNNSVSASRFDSDQQVFFSVDYQQLPINDVRQDFKVNVQQNQREDNAILDLQASQVSAQKLIFENPFRQNFKAGNEFRWFNTRSTRYKTPGVAEIQSNNNPIAVWLIPNEVRHQEDFIRWQDFNGQYIIEHQEGRNPEIDADYIAVHFSLIPTPEIRNKEVYVFGALTDWKILPEAKLNWNAKQKLLQSELYLKQGHYDYQFVTKDAEGISTSDTEGSFYQTRNNYVVYVYYSPFGARYDRLVGVQLLQSFF